MHTLLHDRGDDLTVLQVSDHVEFPVADEEPVQPRGTGLAFSRDGRTLASASWD